DLSETAKDVYTDRLFCKDGEVAPAKNLILKLLLANGGSVGESERVDDRSDSKYCAWRVMVEIRQIDGNVVRYPGSKEIDLRDHSVEIEGLSPGQVKGMRKHIVSNCETKAILRAVRGLLQIRPTYKRSELQQKAFYCYSLVPYIESTDPEMERELRRALM